MDRSGTYHPVGIGRIFFFLLLFSVLSASLLEARQDRGVEIRPSGALRQEAKPGSILAVGIRVTNTSPAVQTYDAQIALPRGWRAITRESAFDLAPGESDVRLLTISIPPETPAGRYQVRYSAKDRASSPHQGEAILEVVVATVTRLELNLLDAPRFAVAGSSYSVSYLLSNKGNATNDVRLSTHSSTDFPLHIDSLQVQLAPREVRTLTVEVLTDTRESKLSHTLELEAWSVQDSTNPVRTSSVVDVISQSTTAEEVFHEYPVFVKLRGFGGEGNTATQVEVFGSGSTTERRTDRLEFLLRGPETQSKSVLGQRDEYRVNYRSGAFEAYVGDANYSLSPLTELGRYAFGGGGKAGIGDFIVGGYYNETRYYEPAQKQAAGFVTYRPGQAYEVDVNYLQKKDPSQSNVVTLRSMLQPISQTDLDVEYGAGSKEGKQDNAYSVRLFGKRQGINYDMRYVQAGTDFGGYYRDVNFKSVGFNIEPLKNTKMEAYVRTEERNLARDTALTYAPFDAYYQFGASYSENIAVYYRQTTSEDLLPGPKYRRLEDAFQIRFGYNFPSASVYANVDLGSSQDRLLAKDYPFKRVSLFTSFKPIATQNYSTSLEYSSDRSIFTDEAQERISASLSAWLLLFQATQVQLNLYGSRLNATSNQTNSLAELSVEHVFPFQHRIILRGRQNILKTSADPDNPSIARESAYSLEYAIPLAIPLKRITTVGQLRGKIVDERGLGIGNVLVNAGGSAAVSDRNGEFLFPSLRPETIYLSVDKASIGLDRVTMQLMPMRIELHGGEETRVDIAVTRGSTIAGSIAVFGPREQMAGDTSRADTVELQPQAGVFLEISNGAELLRRVSDNKGRFTFSDLRPGVWILKVIGGEIPQYHRFERESFEFNVKPGSREHVAMKIVPRKRVIKIIQEGAVIQEEKKEQKPQVQKAPAPPQSEGPCLIYAAPKQSGFMLQFSSWTTKQKAQRLAKEAERLSGYKASVQRATVPKLGVRYRVLVGVFKTRQEAENICEKLQLVVE